MVQDPFRRILTAFLLLAPVLSQAQEFEIPFGNVVSVEDVKASIAEEGKPAVVFVTQPWCGACKALKRSVNVDGEIKALFSISSLRTPVGTMARSGRHLENPTGTFRVYTF